jgi:hypothetical protein
MANADYTNLSDTEKKKLISRYSKSFRLAFKGLGTNTSLADKLVKELREIGSSDLVNAINTEYETAHGETLRKAIVGDYSGDSESKILNSLGFAVDLTGWGFARDNKDKDLLVSNNKDPNSADFDLINKPKSTSKYGKLGTGVQKYIKGAGKTPKATESTPAPESTPPARGYAAWRKQSQEQRASQIGKDDEKAKEISGAIPSTVAAQLSLPKDKVLAKAAKDRDKDAVSGGTSSGSGSKAGLDYLRSREERKQRDKAGKADIAEEQIAGRTRAEGRFSGMKREILAQQAERDRVTKEKSDANKIAIEGAGGKEELLGRVIRDKSGKVIGHSTTSAGRRALGDPYKGVKGGAMDFDKPAESYAELDMRDAAKQRMGSKQQQVMDLWSKGASSEQRKQIAPLREGLGVDPDKIQPFEGAGKTKLDIDATVNEGFHTSDEVAKSPKMESPPPPLSGAGIRNIAQQRQQLKTHFDDLRGREAQAEIGSLNKGMNARFENNANKQALLGGVGVDPNKIQPVEPLNPEPIQVPESNTNIPTPPATTPLPPPSGTEIRSSLQQQQRVRDMSTDLSDRTAATSSIQQLNKDLISKFRDKKKKKKL